MTSINYQGRHRRVGQRAREATLLEAGHELAGRYVLQDRVSPPEPVSFRAEDLLLNRKVIVTFINLDSDYADLIYGSDRNSGISGLRHPALANLFDVGHEPEVRESFIVTDYVEGDLLSELIENPTEGLDLATLRAQIDELLASLVEYLRTHGLEHRDLSPANIRVSLPARADEPEPDESPAILPVSDRPPVAAEQPLIRVGLIGLHSTASGQPDEPPVAPRD